MLPTGWCPGSCRACDMWLGSRPGPRPATHLQTRAGPPTRGWSAASGGCSPPPSAPRRPRAAGPRTPGPGPGTWLSGCWVCRRLWPFHLHLQGTHGGRSWTARPALTPWGEEGRGRQARPWPPASQGPRERDQRLSKRGLHWGGGVRPSAEPPQAAWRPTHRPGPRLSTTPWAPGSTPAADPGPCREARSPEARPGPPEPRNFLRPQGPGQTNGSCSLCLALAMTHRP